MQKTSKQLHSSLGAKKLSRLGRAGAYIKEQRDRIERSLKFSKKDYSKTASKTE